MGKLSYKAVGGIGMRRSAGAKRNFRIMDVESLQTSLPAGGITS